MRRFELFRTEDETGISGIGTIAEGCEFHDGTCYLSWLTEQQSEGRYPTIERLIGIHGHEGKTTVRWIDG